MAPTRMNSNRRLWEHNLIINDGRQCSLNGSFLKYFVMANKRNRSLSTTSGKHVFQEYFCKANCHSVVQKSSSLVGCLRSGSHPARAFRCHSEQASRAVSKVTHLDHFSLYQCRKRPSSAAFLFRLSTSS